LLKGFDWLGGKSGELGPVRRDPRHMGEQLVMEDLEGFWRKETGAGTGTEDGIEDYRRDDGDL